METAIKPWDEYTEAEINAHKREVCVKCQHFSASMGGSATQMQNRTCDYYLTGEARKCHPFLCVQFGKFLPKTRRRKTRFNIRQEVS